MANEIAPTSPGAAAAPAEAGKGDGKASGNITVDQVAAKLVARMRRETQAKPTPPAPAGDIAPTAPAAGQPPAAGQAQADPLATPATTPPASAAPAQIDQGAARPEEAAEVIVQPDLSQFSDLDAKTQERVRAVVEAQKKHVQEMVDKRIAKEVAKSKSLEAALQMARGQQAQAPLASPFTPPPPPQAQPQYQQQAQPLPSAPPLPEVDSVQGLMARQQEAKQIRQTVEDAIALGPNSDGKFNISGQDYTREQVISIRRGATDILENQIPQRYQFLQQRQEGLAAAAKTFPWMTDPQSQEYQQALHIINTNPWVRNLPTMEYTVGMFVEGMKAINGRATVQPPAQPAPRQRPPGDQSAMGGGGTAPSRTSDSEVVRQQMAEEVGKLRKKGGISASELARHLAQRAQLTQSR